MWRAANVPLALSPSEKYVLLPLESDQFPTTFQRDTYRIGQVVRPTSEISLRSISKDSRLSVINGDIPLNRDHQHIHAYGESVNGNQHFQFKMVVEDRDDGAVYTKILMLDSEERDPEKQVVNEIEGFIVNSNQSEGRLDVLSPTQSNTLTIRTRDGIEVVNLGKVHLLVVDCGVLDRSTTEFNVYEHDGQITVFKEIDLTKPGKDPLFADSLASNPALTIPPSRIASNFEALAALNQQQTIARVDSRSSGLVR